jgi:preprotein translocase subunit SecD
MTKYRIWAILVVAISILLAFYIHKSELSTSGAHKLKLGLDLRGGTHLVYRADISKLADADVSSSMNALRDVVERRLNIFGASEPVVQVEQGGVLGGNVREQKLIVELPGIKNIDDAKAVIGQTPSLEFRLIDEEALKVAASSTSPTATSTVDFSKVYLSTGLDGSKVKSASLTYNTQTSEPIVELVFNDEGSTLFAKVTKQNIGKRLSKKHQSFVKKFSEVAHKSVEDSLRTPQKNSFVI